jgi:hypothetical protein
MRDLFTYLGRLLKIFLILTMSSLLEIRQNTNKRAGSKRCLEREPEFAVQIL